LTTHLVQIGNGFARRVALVKEPHLYCLSGVQTIYELAQECLASGASLSKQALALADGGPLDYDAIYTGASEWRLLAAIDVPGHPSRVVVSGTGLTHLGSAKDRQAMHVAQQPSAVEAATDSMRMFQWGVEGGRPAPGQIGVAPEWFYKGGGSILRGPLEPLSVPPFAEDGGEEGEIAGIYIIGPDGTPHRIGMTAGNEFSDHKFEKRNYLNLAGSKLRSCSIGPELVVDADFQSIHGQVRIQRGADTIWHKDVMTGEDNMCHSLANLEHHHFKFEGHRQPGDVHVHFFGAHSLSFGDGIELRHGDWMEVSYDGFGRALRNPIHIAHKDEDRLVEVRSLG
jgi:hypothetical protein